MRRHSRTVGAVLTMAVGFALAAIEIVQKKPVPMTLGITLFLIGIVGAAMRESGNGKAQKETLPFLVAQNGDASRNIFRNIETNATTAISANGSASDNLFDGWKELKK